MLKLKPSEVRFWEEVHRVWSGRGHTGEAAKFADDAVRALRERLEDPGPRPDEGRL